MFVGSVMKKRAEGKLAVYSFMCVTFHNFAVMHAVCEKAVLAALYYNLLLGVL
jgi:hypothetical protein